ncbi:MAG TPA: GNAT family N-acetyltransferase [Candidatus Kapabacteria bacterium]|jgi:GNAT superfamily N-acetyltransferase|nr:GNAT family N-acetyltransferase [Candidatus Kapabacteria bacterium]
MEIVIRDVEDRDASQIAKLLTQLGYPCDSDFARNKLHELSVHPSSQVSVAEVNGTVAGVISFDSQPLFHQAGKLGTIMALSVLESHRGNGIGRKLVKHIERVAKERGCVKIAVASGVHREDAHRFYRSLGYEEITKRFVKKIDSVES